MNKLSKLLQKLLNVCAYTFSLSWRSTQFSGFWRKLDLAEAAPLSWVSSLVSGPSRPDLVMHRLDGMKMQFLGQTGSYAAGFFLSGEHTPIPTPKTEINLKTPNFEYQFTVLSQNT